ncbi:hypothetical protein DL89DRAFT_7924 [Linderina pennispora]|uniref:Gag1-like clamp domain-containing protein n=1 Tax=Linderina pennispora TaxID=61395 RepID=A0A1Y1WKI1_9FUNG|nr:uncharacterized protein DL89DRAFT_7924 [Linderina pennispora]ORX73992.1 hypothetical protein DL89DRAFT_7924 [Linderina pennispora]
MADSITTKPLIGLEHWKAQNARWRAGTKPKGVAEPLTPGSLDGTYSEGRVNPRMYTSIFRGLIVDKRRLKKPLPLRDAIPMLVHGWKRAGVWPTEYTQRPPPDGL